MTLLGKIFTVLIFIASLVLMTVSVMVYASHKNWKQLVKDPQTGLEKQLKDQQELNRNLKQTIQEREDQLRRETVSRAMALQQLQSTQVLQRRRLDLKEQQLAAETQAHQESLARMQEAEARLAEKDKQLATVTSERNRLTDDLAFQNTQVQTLTDKLAGTEFAKRTLEERQNQLAHENAHMKRVMDKFGLDINTLTAHIPPPLDGLVTRVSTKDKGLIELSLGSDDGLRVGHQLDVYRAQGNSYLGRVKVTHIWTNGAVAEVIPSLHKGPIKKNDHVTTKFTNTYSAN